MGIDGRATWSAKLSVWHTEVPIKWKLLPCFLLFLEGNLACAKHEAITQPSGGLGKGQRASQGTVFMAQKAPKNSWTHLEWASRPPTLSGRAAELSVAHE